MTLSRTLTCAKTAYFYPHYTIRKPSFSCRPLSVCLSGSLSVCPSLCHIGAFYPQ